MKLAVNDINSPFLYNSGKLKYHGGLKAYNSGKLKYHGGLKASQFLFGNIQANNVVSPCIKLSMLIIISPKITDNLRKHAPI
jgi:hypothetical protein